MTFTVELRQDDYTSAVVAPVRNLHSVQRWRQMLGGSLAAYSRGGLYARVVDKPADDAVARGVRFSEIGADDEKLLRDDMDRLRVLASLADALRWARLMGGGVIVPIMDDGLRLVDQLNTETIRRIEELRVFGLDEVVEDAPESDPYSPQFGEPALFRVRQGNWDFRVHASRVIGIAGDPLPRSLRVLRAPWAGRSVVAEAFRKIEAYDSSVDNSNAVLERKQQAVYQMTKLAEMLARPGVDGDRLVRQRINNVDTLRGLLNSIVVDADDEYTVQDLSVAGIERIVEINEVRLSAATGIPVAILFGRSATGMNATGAADFSGYYDLLEGIQRTKLHDPLDRILNLMMRQEHLRRIREWRHHWTPLDSPSEKERAQINQHSAAAALAKANAAVALTGANLLLPEEARGFLADEDYDYDLVDDATYQREIDAIEAEAQVQAEAIATAGTAVAEDQPTGRGAGGADPTAAES